MVIGCGLRRSVVRGGPRNGMSARPAKFTDKYWWIVIHDYTGVGCEVDPAHRGS